MFVTLPGTVGPLRSLDEMLRESHEARRDSIAKQISHRVENGIPLDDTTDWVAVALRLVDTQAIAEQQDGQALRQALSVLMERVSGGLEPMPEYVPEESLDGVLVRLRAVSEAALQQAMEGVRAELARPGGDVRAPMTAFVQSAVGEVIGLETIDENGDRVPVEIRAHGGLLPSGSLDVLDSAGLLVALYATARDFQQLPPKKKERYGSPLLSISGPLTAPRARDLDDEITAVTAASPASHGSPAADLRATHARGASSSTSPGSMMRMRSGQVQEVESPASQV